MHFGETCFLTHISPSHCILVLWKGTSRVSGASLIKAEFHWRGCHTHDLSTSQRPHVLMPSYWALGFQHMDCVGVAGGHRHLNHSNQPSTKILYFFKPLYVLKDFIYLFLERGEGREKERERNINVWLPLACPLLGTWPVTQACALTGS